MICLQSLEIVQRTQEGEVSLRTLSFPGGFLDVTLDTGDVIIIQGPDVQSIDESRWS